MSLELILLALERLEELNEHGWFAKSEDILKKHVQARNLGCPSITRMIKEICKIRNLARATSSLFSFLSLWITFARA